MIQHHLVVRPLVAAGLIAIGATTSPASAMQTSSCAESAAVIRAAQPDYPALSESRGDSGTAYVRISLLSNGRLADATIDQSSGIAALDKAALQATHESEFMPERRNCAPVAGSYLFVVSFER